MNFHTSIPTKLLFKDIPYLGDASFLSAGDLVQAQRVVTGALQF